MDPLDWQLDDLMVYRKLLCYLIEISRVSVFSGLLEIVIYHIIDSFKIF
jgi:hypothetical protein